MEKGAEKKNNFRIALDEIMKGKMNTSLSDTKEPEKMPEESLVVEHVVPIINKEPENNTNNILNNLNININNSYRASGENTVISEGTVIEGSIITKSNLIVQGDVNGDIESEKDIEIIGRIMGNVKGNNSVFLKGSVNGNVSGPTVFTMTKESKVIGDINCQELECDGNITGNVNATVSVYFGANSIIKGNVIAKSISVKEGSQIKGSMEIL